MVVGVTLFVVAVLIISIWVVIEVKRMRHKVFAIVLIALVLLSYISATVIFKDQEIDFTTTTGLMKAGKIYFTFLGSVFGNLRVLVANAIKMNWKGNQTAS